MNSDPSKQSPDPELPANSYPGPRDVGRAGSLYRSASNKGDLDYSTQLLLASLIANPEHDGALRAILSKPAAFAAAGRKMVVRISDDLSGSPADAFIRSLATFCASSKTDDALSCAAEAQKTGLHSHAATLGGLVLQSAERGETSPKPASLGRLIDVLEACGALALAVRAAKCGARLFPDDQALREREKNLLASKYLKDTNIASSSGYRDQLRDKLKQEAMHRPQDAGAKLDALEQRYRQTSGLEDFRDLVRALRESSSERREVALPVLEDGLKRFGDRETRWFVKEIRLERQAVELRVRERSIEERPDDERARSEHEALRQSLTRERVDHLYEVVSALPNTPERNRRQLELAAALFDAARYEEAIKQAQDQKRRGENKLDAWVIMAKSFVQLGLTFEAGECFEHILSELDASARGSTQHVLEAKYTYAQFLADQSAKSKDPALARQARKLCSDVMIEDIDYRDVRQLAGQLDASLCG